MRRFLTRLKAGTEHLNYGREAMAAMAASHAEGLADGELRILDIGMGSGADLENMAGALAPRPVALYGLENYPPYVAAAEKKGIAVAACDVERERFPFEDRFFHLVIANQLLEHTKEIFWIAGEVSRVLAPGGAFLVGVPNLASLHSRLMLGMGMQPSSIEPLGPHVRGFTKGGFRRFIEADGYFSLEETRGANFYPFPTPTARLLARLFPTFSVGLVLRCVRTSREGTFLDTLSTRFYETSYFTGNRGAGD